MKIYPILLVAALLTGAVAVASADDQRLSSVTVSPQVGTLTYGAGGPATYTVTLTRKTGDGSSGAFSATLSQTATLPSGAVVSFLPAKVDFAAGELSKTSTLTISTAGSTRAGATSIKVKAKVSDNSVSGSGTLAISKAPLTVTANADSRIYNARAYSAANGVTYSGFVLGETPAVLDGALTLSSPGAVSAGSYTITPGGLTSSNYAITFVSGALTIQPAVATVTANNKSKTYGDPNPALDATVAGTVTGGDAISYSLATAAAQFSGVAGGPYAITVSLGSNPNYSITPTNGALAIQPAIATVRASSKSKTYGGLNPALDATVTGAVTGGDAILYSLATAATQFSNVLGGPYAIAVSLGANPNYSITPIHGTLTINPAVAAVTTNGKSKTYGDANPALDATVTGAVTGGDAILYTLATTAAQFSNVATSPYPIAVTLGANPNYSVTPAGGTLAINRAIATVRANNKSKAYGVTNPALDATVTGAVTGGDAILYTVATTAAQFSNVATSPYPITVSLGANPNYNVTPTNGTLAIQAAAATVRANNKSKTYGDANPALDAAVTGAVTGGDAILYTVATTATQFSNVATSPYAITVSLGANPNYSATPTNGTLAINAAVATVKANNKSKAYGDANPALDAAVTGAVTGGDAIAYTVTTTATQFSNVATGPYPITVALGANPNYSVTPTNGTLSVQPAVAAVNATSKSKVYGNQNPTLEAAVTGQATGGAAIVYTLATTATQFSNVATSPYPITVNLGANPNYNIVVTNATLTIQPMVATVRANNKTKTYGDLNPTLDATLAGQVTGGDLINYTLATAATQFSNVATSPYTITVTLGANPNYTVGPANGTLTVQAAIATVKANGKSKTYGETNPGLDATVTGAVTGGDAILYTLTTTAAQYSNVADGPYPIAVTLGANPNYSITPTNATLTIQRAVATVTANNKTKTYGDQNPALDATVAGQVTEAEAFNHSRLTTVGVVTGGDPILYTLATVATQFTGVANSPYAITVTLGSNPNYNVTATNGTLTINAAVATVKANSKTKTYGDLNPTLSATVTGQVTGGDPILYSLSTAATQFSNVADSPYAIAVTLGLNPNYSVRVPADNGTLTIQRANATVTANNKNRTYGGTGPTLDATVVGQVTGGDAILYTLATTATQFSNVATSPYPITVTLGSNPNYSVTPASGAFTIDAAFATVKANGKTRAYGIANPALDATVTGEVPGGDRINYSLSTTATSLSNVLGGPYAINVTLGYNPNYSVKVPADNGTLRIQPAAATVTANDKSKIYGTDNPALDATVTGQVTGGDPIYYALATLATPLSGVLGGPYAITVALGSNPNYSVTPTSGALTVNPAFATVKANNKTRAYGAANPTPDATVTGEVPGGDRVIYTLAHTALLLSSVAGGPYAINVTLGYNPNYSVKVPADNGTLRIQPAAATVTANDKSKIYGTNNPALDATVTGQVTGGDPIYYALATLATPLSGVLGGPYAITVALGSNPNYSVTATSGALTVNPALATVKANNKTRVYGAANPTPDATVTGEVPGGDRVIYALAHTALPLSSVAGGPYAINVTLGFNPNYSVKVPADNGMLTINPAAATVTANDRSKIYGSTNPGLGATVTGEVTGGDAVNYTLATAATQFSNVGTSPYAITVTLGLNSNYSVTATSGALTVNSAFATVKANNKSRAYGAANPTPDATVTGEVPGGDRINYTLTHTALPLSSVRGGPYAINVTLGYNPNYSVKVPADNGGLTINPAAATVTANNKTRSYGGANPALDAAVTGEVTGGDRINYTLTTTATQFSNVATSPYVISVTLGSNPNYSVAPTNGTLTVQRATATLSLSNMTKIYGDPNPTLNVTVTGQVTGGDPINSTVVHTATQCSSVAGSPYPYTVTPGSNPNYSLTVTNGALTVLPRPVTVRVNDKAKIYGGANPALDVTVTNPAVGCDPVVYSLSTAVTQFSNVVGGPYAITVIPGANPNYTVTVISGALTIQPAIASVTANSKTKIYSDINPALDATVTGEVTSVDAVKYSVAALGAVTGGDPILYTLATTATQFSGVTNGPYPITVSLGANPNYSVTPTNGTLTIQVRPVAVKVNNKTRTYGDANPALDATVTGTVVGGDPVNYTLATAATQCSGVAGSPYAMTVSLGANPNYSVTTTGGTLTIQTRPVTVTASGRTKVYGDADPALIYQVTSGTLVCSDAFSGALSRVAGESVTGSPSAINRGTLSLSDNYALTYVGANLTITPATLTVTAAHQSKVYGELDPTLSYVPSGFKFSDNAAGVLTGGLTRAVGQTVAGGPYAIQKGTLAANSNYTIGFTGQNLEITTRPVTVAANARAKIFGGVTPTLTYVITSGSLAYTDAFTGALDRASGESVTGGPYAIVQGTLALNSNYALTYVGASLSISTAQATPTLTIAPSPQQYSDFVLFTATVANGYAGGQQAMDAVTVKVGTNVLGTITLAPSGSSLTGTLSIALLEPAPGIGPRAPGTYTVTGAEPFANPNFAVTPLDPAALIIIPEDARAASTGAILASTTGSDDEHSSSAVIASSSSSSSSGKATVTLSATIRDITATSDAAGDASFGDIRNATVTFVDRDHANAVIATVPMGLVSSGDTKTGTVTYDWPVSIGSAASKQLRVGTIVSNYYARNSSDDDIVVTVSKPASNTTIGDGYLVMSNSSGILAGGAGTRNDFSFSLKRKSGGSLSGSIKSTVRSGGRVYQVESSTITSHAVQLTTAGGTATLDGKASVKDITNPNASTTIDDNATLQVTMADLGTPGTADGIAITVWNKKGGLWFASNWDGVQTIQQVLGGGDLQVRGGSGGSSAQPTAAIQSTSASAGLSGTAVPLAYAFPQNFPNPFSESTNIRFELPERSRVTLLIYDVMGREVANLVDREVEPGFHVAAWSGRNREGYPAGAGVYFARIVATSLNGSGGLRSDRRIILVK